MARRTGDDGGELPAMAGATKRPNRAASHVLAALGIGLRGKTCRPFHRDTKVLPELPGHASTAMAS